jgi:hypothetical protein
MVGSLLRDVSKSSIANNFGVGFEHGPQLHRIRVIFFCGHDNVHSLTVRTILGGLLRQSLRKGDIPEILESNIGTR